MFYQIFLSPQVERRAIITYEPGISELRHELPNDLRLDKMIALCQASLQKTKFLQILARNS